MKKEKGKKPFLKAALDAYEMPDFTLPTVPITNAGPAFMQKRFSLAAVCLLIFPLSSSSELIFAPTGKPPISDMNITGEQMPGSPKISLAGFFIILPIKSDIPE